MELLSTLEQYGLVPVIKLNDPADAVPLCDALKRGGLPVAEITFRTDAAEESIRRVAKELPDVILGAGTVLTIDQVDRAVNAGARYIVSPGLNPKVVGYCVEKNIPVLPGCSSPSDIEAALEFGLKAVKFFPAESIGGLAAIKAMSAPYGSLRFVPTGGISEKNLNDYLSFPKILACGGSWMVKDEWVADKAWDKIESAARAAVALTLGFEVAHVGVNCDDMDAAQNAAKRFSALFGWPVRTTSAGAFSGVGIEVMGGGGRGKNGHIAVGVNSITRAKAYLESLGVTFVPPAPGAKAIYMEEEIAGFAVHLLQK